MLQEGKLWPVRSFMWSANVLAQLQSLHLFVQSHGYAVDYYIYSCISRPTYKLTPPIPVPKNVAKLSDLHISWHRKSTFELSPNMAANHSCISSAQSSFKSASLSVRWLLSSLSAWQLTACVWLCLNDGLAQCECWNGIKLQWLT